jgi:hypothetical protein
MLKFQANRGNRKQAKEIKRISIEEVPAYGELICLRDTQMIPLNQISMIHFYSFFLCLFREGKGKKDLKPKGLHMLNYKRILNPITEFFK